MAASNDKNAFTGTWVLDSKRSQSLDEVLKAQGVGLIKRKAIDNSKITQKLSVNADASELALEFHSTFKTKTDTIKLDGSPAQDQNDDGEAVTRKAFWKEENGEIHLVVDSANEVKGNSISVVRRVIEDGKTLEQNIIFKGKDGKELSAKRYFTKQ
eukprot:CAMPEP_0168554794 /NCGR_PEP_ID=MMETSP0413-20121227/7977_1 /TAXON_ID=136452 /ORGANISM="Filamoeba nolandi, Strain NC-AS-23-1" /LENGTH=155 /DNA_ID=CAMNT_0008585573 /DNA_START=24 /DNA_END=491 /DNA_ORIENTATION=-